MIPDRAIVIIKLLNILCMNLVPLSIGAGGKTAKKMNWNGDDPDGYCWAMPLTPATFGAGSQLEHVTMSANRGWRTCHSMCQGKATCHPLVQP